MEQTLFELSIDAKPVWQYLVNLMVFDKDNDIVMEGSHYPISVALPKGLYTIRLESNGNIVDKVILLDKNSHHLIGNSEHKENKGPGLLTAPAMFSVVPLEERCFQSTTSYYLKAAVDNAKTFTTVSWRKQGEPVRSSLFIFLRYANATRFQELITSQPTPAWENIKILDHLGNTFFDFGKRQFFQKDEFVGWAAFNAEMDPGLYFIRYQGKESRQFPIYLLENKHTQVFLQLEEEPVYAGMRIFLQDQRIFDPTDRTAIYTDLLLTRLQSHDYTIDEVLEQEIRSGKYKAFMLQLLYIYMLAMNNEKWEDLATQPAFQQLFLSHDWVNGILPDIMALTMWTAQKDDALAADAFIKGLPILRFGWEIIRRLALKDTSLIREQSLVDLVTLYMKIDSPYTTFEPIQVQVDEFNIPDIRDWVIDGYKPSEEAALMATEWMEGNCFYYRNIPLDTGSEVYLWNTLAALPEPAKANWLETLMYNYATQPSRPPHKQISNELQLPLITIKRTIQDMINRLSESSFKSAPHTLREKVEQWETLQGSSLALKTIQEFIELKRTT